MSTDQPRHVSIGVIETGQIPEELVDEFADYPQMVADWLGPAWPSADWPSGVPIS